MSGLEAVKDEIHGLSNEIAGLKPIVKEMHLNMPRITKALETLARVTEKQESNVEDHKRLHHRINENKEQVETVAAHHEELRRQVDGLEKEHLICFTVREERRATAKERRENSKNSFWARVRFNVTERIVEYLLVTIVLFLAWIVLFHLPQYPLIAPIIKQGMSAPVH